MIFFYLHPHDHQINLSFLTESKNVFNFGGNKGKDAPGNPMNVFQFWWK